MPGGFFIPLLLLASTLASLVRASSEAGSGSDGTVTCSISSQTDLCSLTFGGSYSICGDYTGTLSAVNGAYNKSELVKADSTLYLQTTSSEHTNYWFIATSSWTQHETDGYINMNAPWPHSQLAYASFELHDAHYPGRDHSFCNMDNPSCPGVVDWRGWINGDLGTTSRGSHEYLGCDITIECTHRPSCPTEECGAECCSSREAHGECKKRYEEHHYYHDYHDHSDATNYTHKCSEDEWEQDGRGCPDGPEGGCAGSCCLGQADNWCNDNYKEGFVCINNMCGEDDCCVPGGVILHTVAPILGAAVVGGLLCCGVACAIGWGIFCCVAQQQQQQNAARNRAAVVSQQSIAGHPMPYGGGGGGVAMSGPAALGMPMAVAQPMTEQQSLTVTVPPGMGPGSQLQVTSQQGQNFMVTVPNGVESGQQFMVNMPAPVVATAVAMPGKDVL